MAKRKAKVDRPAKLTHVELDNAQKLIGAMTDLQMNLGRLETEKFAILNRLGAIQEMIDKLQQDFVKKYGTSDIDIKSGKINYNSTNPYDDEAN